jgi:hypothetical protein
LRKSFVSLDLCARISAGRSFPDGAATAGPANCVIVNAEDGVDVSEKLLIPTQERRRLLSQAIPFVVFHRPLAGPMASSHR